MKIHLPIARLLFMCWFPASAGLAAASEPIPVHITVDAAKSLGQWQPIWRYFGADEPNYATMPHGRKLLGELGEFAPGRVFFRTHNLLTSGDGTPALKWGSTGVYRENEQGEPSYDWHILDDIFDTYALNHVRPYVQVGFMPEALSIKPSPYQHHWGSRDRYGDIFTGWAYPPKDYDRWSQLSYAWVRHCIGRYGRGEVARWYWEVWNEANIGYWKGTPEEFRKLHDYAVAGVRRALPGARVGGPDCAGDGGRWLRDFLEHCLRGTNFATGRIGTPLNFISFHAKGSPTYTNGHVRMGIANQLRTIDAGFGIIASYPELKRTPVVIGESDPEGCAACQGDQLGYRNGTMYSSYTAASFPRKLELARRHGVNLEGALTWAFTFEDQPLFAGFRQLATGGLDLPVLNVFRMFSQLEGRQIEAASDGAVPLDEILRHGVRNGPDIAAVAVLNRKQLAVLAWYYHDDDAPGPDAAIALTCNALPRANGSASLKHYRIDARHSNSFEAWKAMGSPLRPTAEQYAIIEAAGHLQELADPAPVRIANHQAVLNFKLPRQGVSLLVMDF